MADGYKIKFICAYTTLPAKGAATPSSGGVLYFKEQKMVCPKCGSRNVTVQVIAEQKKRSCAGACCWLLLAACTCGLVLLIPLLTRTGSKTKQYAVCQDCGNKWRV